MNKNHTQQQLYIIFWIVIVILIGLIGWFTYLLIKPDNASTVTTANTETTTNSVTANVEKKSKKKKTTNANSSANANSDVTAANSTVAADGTDTNTAGGLVEPTNSTNNESSAAETDTNTNQTTEASTAEGDKTVTLYFPKSTASCGEVYPVERRITESDDPYGQIILEAMAGPTEAEAEYTSAVPADLYLRRVEYTADGAVITVSEAYDNLDECNQQTVTAQLVETANAMFELPAGTAGEVVVGTVSDDEDETTDSEEAVDSSDNKL